LGPVERAIRSSMTAGAKLFTLSRGASFQLSKIDNQGVVLDLAMRWPTRLSWSCLEGVVPWLRGRGWVLAAGVHSVQSQPGSLDEYLKRCVMRNTTNWVVVVLREAGLVEVDIGPPLRVRLSRDFA
jgi:hypothetical protein